MTSDNRDQSRLLIALLFGLALHIIFLVLFLVLPRTERYTPKPLIGAVEVTLAAVEAQDLPLPAVDPTPVPAQDNKTPTTPVQDRPKPSPTKPSPTQPSNSLPAKPVASPVTETYEPVTYQEFAIPVPPPPVKSKSNDKPTATADLSGLEGLDGIDTASTGPNPTTPQDTGPTVMALGGATVTMEGAKEGRTLGSHPLPEKFPPGTVSGKIVITFKVLANGDVQTGSIKPITMIPEGQYRGPVYESLKTSISKWTFSKGEPNSGLITVTVAFAIKAY